MSLVIKTRDYILITLVEILVKRVRIKLSNAFLEFRPPVLVWELRLGFHSGWLELLDVGAPTRALGQ
jgi:hypothetical protein